MQGVLFEQSSPSPISAHAGLQLAEGCHYFENYLTLQAASDLLHRLWTELGWQQRTIRIFGREVMQPRLICWQSDPAVIYSYSGLKLEPAAWHPSLNDLRRQLHTDLGADFNSVLINAYRNGQDSMGWHADDEPELGRNPLIASVSLGAARNFRWREKAAHKSAGVEIRHGSLLLLSGDFQQSFQHSVPKTRKETGLRINLTFRQIRPATNYSKLRY